MRRRPRALLLSLVLSLVPVLALLAASCGSDAETSGSSASTATPTTVEGTVTVSAAASLTEALGTIRSGFLAANRGADVVLNVGSSGQLEAQIEAGAPADVAAFADEATMQKLADAGLLDGEARVFATNQLVIVTKPGNPTAITSLGDLAKVATVALCATSAPCGRYADQVLRAAGVTLADSQVTRGQDVKATLSAVRDGDADAGIVYVTDGLDAGDAVSTVDIPTAENAVARYPIAVVAGSRSRSAAQAFVDYVLGPEGQAALRDAGFGSP